MFDIIGNSNGKKSLTHFAKSNLNYIKFNIIRDKDIDLAMLKMYAKSVLGLQCGMIRDKNHNILEVWK